MAVAVGAALVVAVAGAVVAAVATVVVEMVGVTETGEARVTSEFSVSVARSRRRRCHTCAMQWMRRYSCNSGGRVH